MRHRCGADNITLDDDPGSENGTTNTPPMHAPLKIRHQLSQTYGVVSVPSVRPPSLSESEAVLKEKSLYN